MRTYILLFLYFYTIAGFSQSCNCIKDFDFVVNKVEKNHPGFKLNITKKNKESYQKLKNKVLVEITNTVKTDVDCAKAIRKYLAFIKDKHLKIYSTKTVDEKVYEKSLFTKKLPKFKIINDINYIKVPSFSYRLWKHLDRFYDSITPIVKEKQNVILDIRSNSGGGERMYKQLLKLIKRKNIVVLFNRKCASACEEVALKVKTYKNAIAIGENTNGQFAYGFINSYKTPNCKLTFIIPTKKYKKRLKYEYVGVPPDIKSSKEKDWIQLAIKELKK